MRGWIASSTSVYHGHKRQRISSDARLCEPLSSGTHRFHGPIPLHVESNQVRAERDNFADLIELVRHCASPGPALVAHLQPQLGQRASAAELVRLEHAVKIARAEAVDVEAEWRKSAIVSSAAPRCDTPREGHAHVRRGELRVTPFTKSTQDRSSVRR